MAPSFCIDISEPEQGRLLDIARQSIESGLAGGTVLQLDVRNLTGALSIPLAVFVTLTRFEALRGCTGSLESSGPLAQSVADSAFNTAFHDHRFPTLDASEIDDTRIEISVLSELEPLAAANRADLLNRLRAGEDGLLLEDGNYRSTFLPKMWDILSDPEEFLDHLLVKAGLAGGYWSETIGFKRYQALSFNE
ncbi:MAG: AmmeMemoRadiSam system protein A [Gammaproteobacteria bacterium]